LLTQDGEDAIKFKFFYTGRDNLHDCIKGDGFCSIRNALLLTKGFVPELPNAIERGIVRAKDVDFTIVEGLNETLSFISDMLSKLDADNSLRSADNEIRERCKHRLSGMMDYLVKRLPDVLKRNGDPFLTDTSLWLDTYAIPIISAYTGISLTVFETSKRFLPTTAMTKKGLRWWLALHAGDGVNSNRFHTLFTYTECHDVISRRSGFCTTGVSGRETQASSKDGILCHFYPIATHTSDMSAVLDESVESIAEALHTSKDIALLRYALLTRSLSVLLLLLVHFFYDWNKSIWFLS
jgi:hypothetical protein